ncbi:MAG TPA: AMP-binding protein [Stellaceae bacterium]|nr:AMP-binding protein [Stellaceae bacterium]
MDLSSWLERRADFTPDRSAIHFEGSDYSWAALARQMRQLAGALAAQGIGRGDPIAHLGYNSPLFLVLLFACARLGAMLVPLNWRLAAPEHRVVIADAEPKLLVHDAGFAQAAARLGAARTLSLDALAAALPAASEREADPAASYALPLLIVYTSGTTGRPKGAVLTQEALLWNAVNSTVMHDLTSADHVLTTLPMFHVGGLNIQTLPALHAGASVTLHPRFDADATLTAIAERRPSLAVLVPAQLAALIAHPAWAQTDLSCLRAITTGSSIVPTPLIEAIHARGVPVIQVYGSTETAPIAIYQTPRDAFLSVGSCGKPALHCAARIVDGEGRDVPRGARGEILVRGPNVMSFYWRNPEASAAALRDGWFHTGDIGHVDERGYYFIDERKHDVIIAGGENIYPAEVEAILLAEPRIAEAAVVARPDPRWGEVPVAVIVLRPGAAMAAAEVLALFHEKIARFKQPRDVVFAAALPKNALGKVLRYELRRQVAAQG